MVYWPNLRRNGAISSATRQKPPVQPRMYASPPYPLRYSVPAMPMNEAADIQSAPVAMPL